jgi:polar amino acid transport system substrate-binding protein
MKKLFTAGVAALALVAGLAGCATPETDGSSAMGKPARSAKPVAVDQSIRALVPAQFRDAGVIAGGANFQAPPFAMYEPDGKTPSGAMVKIVDEAAGIMGLKVTWSQMLIADIIPAMQAKKVYIGGSMMASNAGIIESTNIITTVANHQGILALPNKASQFDSLDGICGKNIGMGTSALATQQIVGKIGKICQSEGKPAPKKTLLSATAAITLATQSGKIDGGMIPAATVDYVAQNSGGKLVATKANETIAEKIDQGIEGFSISKDQPELAKAFQKAVQKMMDDGDYQAILQQFKISPTNYEKTSNLNKAS